MIYFVIPIWEDLKSIRAIKISLRGVNAVAGGLIAIAAVILTLASGVTVENLIVTAIAAGILAFTKIPAPLIVLATLIAGVLF